MPRVGSRGKPVTAEFLDEMQQYLSVDEGTVWVRRMRFLYCPEAELIEQDIQELLDLFLPNRLSSIDRLIESLTGGGIIPAAIKGHVSDIRFETERLLRLVQRLSTPIIGVG